MPPGRIFPPDPTYAPVPTPDLISGDDPRLRGAMELQTGQPPVPPPKPPVPQEDFGVRFGKAAVGTVTEGIPDALRSGADTFTAGQAPRLSALYDYGVDKFTAPYGKGPANSYDDYLQAHAQKIREMHERSPIATTVGDVGGAIAQNYVPGMKLLSGEALAGKFGKSMTARAAGGAASGFGQGFLQGAGHTYSDDWKDYLAHGTEAGLYGAALGAPMHAAFGKRPDRSSVPVPSIETVKNVAKQGYEDLETMPARYTPGRLSGPIADRLERIIGKKGGNADDNKKTYAAIQMLRDLANKPEVTPLEIERIRQKLSARNIPYGSTEGWSAGLVRDAIDDFYLNPGKAVVPGTEFSALSVSHHLLNTRGNYAASKRAGFVRDKMADAITQTEGANSGMNAENKIRTASGKINSSSPAARKNTLGWIPSEREAAAKLSKGNFPLNTMRGASNLFGGGGGLGMFLTGGGGLAGYGMGWSPLGQAASAIVPPAVGWGLKSVGNKLAKEGAKELQETLLKRSPHYIAQSAGAPMIPGRGLVSGPMSEAVRNSVVLRMLMSQEDPNSVLGAQEDAP